MNDEQLGTDRGSRVPGVRSFLQALIITNSCFTFNNRSDRDFPEQGEKDFTSKTIVSGLEGARNVVCFAIFKNYPLEKLNLKVTSQRHDQQVLQALLKPKDLGALCLQLIDAQ